MHQSQVGSQRVGACREAVESHTGPCPHHAVPQKELAQIRMSFERKKMAITEV